MAKKKKDELDSKLFGKSEWQKIKEVVDSIFTETESERDKMSRYLKQFQGDIWDQEALEDANVEESYRSKAHINLVFSTIEAIAPMFRG